MCPPEQILGNDWMLSHTELMRSGYTWVGVSAQARGVSALKSCRDEARYAPLDHPGDSFSYSMYSQIGTALEQSQRVTRVRWGLWALKYS